LNSPLVGLFSFQAWFSQPSFLLDGHIKRSRIFVSYA
jgi:hypothetical protein